MKMYKLLLTIAVIISIPLISLAHPGHGETGGYTIIHYFVEPTHAIVTYGILVATIVYVQYLRRKEKSSHN